MKLLRTFLGSLIDPVLGAHRTYEVAHQSGLMPQLMASLRVPDGRPVRSVSLMQAGTTLAAATHDGWVEVTVPRVLIHEAVRVDLA